MKLCSKCNMVSENFSINSSRSDGLQTWCKSCVSIYDKSCLIEKRQSRYLQNKVRYNRNRRFVLDFLRSNPCIDCGEKDPVVLEFDHIDKKNNDVSTLVKLVCSIKKIEDEIALCVIRCANCHRRKTAKQRSYFNEINSGL